MQRRFSVPLHFAVSIAVLLVTGVAPVFAQRTVTKDAGGDRKIVLHYNAADQITETDTYGPQGELMEKDTLTYRPNAYVPQTFNTSYWPNGKPHKVTNNTYDDNSNFTSEFIQIFDDSGKQVGGHKLTHDPITNLYTCADWVVASQSYKSIECPEGEEGGGGHETAKVFTQDEVMQQLARAHQAANNPQPGPPPSAVPAAPPSTATSVKEVGLVFPSHIRVGERVSGSVVENPADYDGNPQVMVTRIALPLGVSGNVASLAGWTVEMSGEPPQPADGPIRLTIPPGQVDLAVLFRAPENVGAPVSKAIPLPHAEKRKTPTAYQAPATCIKGQLCMVNGPFSGDSSKAFAAFSDHPAKIIAETTTAAYIAIPDAVDSGNRPLVISEGSKAIAFPMVVTKVSMRPDRRTLKEGEKLLIYEEVEGPEKLPDSAWHPGNFPPSNLDLARQLVSGYQVPRGKHEDHDAEEKREAKEKQTGAAGEKDKDKDEDHGGEILLVVKTSGSAGMNFWSSKNGTYVFHLRAGSFKMGEFKYKFVVDAPKGGTFSVQSNAIPFLAPVAGQEFPITGDATK